jgi:hypothetical protein
LAQLKKRVWGKVLDSGILGSKVSFGVNLGEEKGLRRGCAQAFFIPYFYFSEWRGVIMPSFEKIFRQCSCGF